MDWLLDHFENSSQNKNLPTWIAMGAMWKPNCIKSVEIVFTDFNSANLSRQLQLQIFPILVITNCERKIHTIKYLF